MLRPGMSTVHKHTVLGYQWARCMRSTVVWKVSLFAGHNNDVIISTIASQITSLTIVHSTVYPRRRSKKTSKLHVTGLCEWNSAVTGEFPAQMASNAENVSIWLRHRVFWLLHDLSGWLWNGEANCEIKRTFIYCCAVSECSPYRQICSLVWCFVLLSCYRYFSMA